MWQKHCAFFLSTKSVECEDISVCSAGLKVWINIVEIRLHCVIQITLSSMLQVILLYSFARHRNYSQVQLIFAFFPLCGAFIECWVRCYCHKPSKQEGSYTCVLKERAARRGLFAVLVSKRGTTKYPTAFQSQGELPGQTAAVWARRDQAERPDWNWSRSRSGYPESK